MLPAAFREQFPVLERVAYLNAGSDGPLPAAAVSAGQAALEAEGADGRGPAHFEARQAACSTLRDVYAGLLGAAAEDVSLTTSTSEGLGKVIAGLGLEPGDEILTSDGEHPGLIGPLLAARSRGVTIRTGPLATLADHVTEATTVIACSHVGWHSGQLADPRLGETGVPVVLDGAQGIGAVPVDVRALGCLAYAAAGQKWLCGADGTGMLYLAPEHRGRVAAPAPPFLAFTDPLAGLDSDLHVDARRHDTPALAREVAAVSLTAADVLAGFGWYALFARGAALARGLAESLARRGARVVERSDTTLVAWEDPDPPATSARLAQAGVLIRHLPGTPYLRASVGAWNDETDLQRLLEAL